MKKVLVIGAGPIKIGHACEFDYSGTQICNTLKSEGICTILVNSNPATFMTSEGVADKIYLEPLNTETILKILEKERPDAIAVFAGGQVALNLALKLESYRNKLKFIGTDINCIKNSEDRMRFHEILQNNNIDFLKGFLVDKNKSIDSKLFPVILRTS